MDDAGMGEAGKLLDADWLVTCSAYARDHLAALDFSGEKVELVYHGLDGDRFLASPDRNRSETAPTPKIRCGSSALAVQWKKRA